MVAVGLEAPRLDACFDVGVGVGHESEVVSAARLGSTARLGSGTERNLGSSVAG